MINDSGGHVVYLCHHVMFGNQTRFLTLTSKSLFSVLGRRRRQKRQSNQGKDRMKRRVEQLVPYLSFRNNILTIPGYRFAEVSCLSSCPSDANAISSSHSLIS